MLRNKYKTPIIANNKIERHSSGVNITFYLIKFKQKILPKKLFLLKKLQQKNVRCCILRIKRDKYIRFVIKKELVVQKKTYHSSTLPTSHIPSVPHIQYHYTTTTQPLRNKKTSHIYHITLLFVTLTIFT